MWFLEAIKHSTMELYETTITILESAVFHMEEAQNTLNDLTQTLETKSGKSSSTKKSESRKDTGIKGYSAINPYTGGRPMKSISERPSGEELSYHSQSEGDAESMFKATARFKA